MITSKTRADFDLENHENVDINKVDIFDTEKLAEVIKDSDVVISSYAPPHDNNELIVDASKSLIEAAKKGNTRVLAVGGAGSLKVTEDLLLVDAPDFPAAYKPVAIAHKNALEKVYRPESEVNWTNVSPAAYIFEGERTGQFKVGEDFLITNEKGDSAISMEDFAVGILDEVENASYPRKRFTLGYS